MSKNLFRPPRYNAMNSQPYHRQCYACNKFGHKANQWRSKIMNSYMSNNNVVTSHLFYGYCTTYETSLVTRLLILDKIKSGYAPQHSITFYNCNKSRHIARFCKMNKRHFASQKKVDLVQKRKEMDKIQKIKEENEVKDGSISMSSVEESFDN